MFTHKITDDNLYADFQEPVEQPIAGQSVARRSVKRTAEATAAVEEEDGNGSSDNGRNLRRSRGAFAAKCFAVHRKESTATSSFHCKDLLGHSRYVETVEFSDDGTLLASGGLDKIVRLWPISNKAEVERGHIPIAPIEMETRHDSVVYSLAFAPDNRRIFSDGSDSKILIHDVET